MKENKIKPKKILNKQSKKNAEKDLEIKITDRFTDVIKGLGHNSDKITKEIKKASKLFSKKLIESLGDLKESVENKVSKSRIKEAKASIRAEEKAKKVVIKATRKYPKGDKVLTNAQKHIIPEFSLPVIIDANQTKSSKSYPENQEAPKASDISKKNTKSGDGDSEAVNYLIEVI